MQSSNYHTHQVNQLVKDLAYQVSPCEVSKSLKQAQDQSRLASWFGKLKKPAIGSAQK